MKLTHISLFSGIGGMDLAAEWAGFTTVLQCEIDPFCQVVLRKHFPGVPIIEDVHDVTRETIINAISQSRRADTEAGLEMGGKLLPQTERNESANRANASNNSTAGFRITLLTAGVPCQPASTAGKRRGKTDDRWLWPEAIRILSELQPTWFIAENPAGIISLGESSSPIALGPATIIKGQANDFYSRLFSQQTHFILGDLLNDIEKAGYEVQPILIPACGVEAYHRRDRVFIIAHARSNRGEARLPKQAQRQEGNSGIIEYGSCEPLFNPAAIEGLPDWAGGTMSMPSPLTEFVANSETTERRRNGNTENDPGRWRQETGGQDSPRVRQRKIEREFRIVASGLPERLVRPVRNRVSQLKAYGNAVVPQQVYPIFKAIAEIESR